MCMKTYLKVSISTPCFVKAFEVKMICAERSSLAPSV
jgi:hypothetical protein